MRTPPPDRAAVRTVSKIPFRGAPRFGQTEDPAHDRRIVEMLAAPAGVGRRSIKGPHSHGSNGCNPASISIFTNLIWKRAAWLLGYHGTEICCGGGLLALIVVVGTANVAAAAPSSGPCDDPINKEICDRYYLGGDCNGYVDVNCQCDDSNTVNCESGEDCTLYVDPVSQACIVG